MFATVFVLGLILAPIVVCVKVWRAWKRQTTGKAPLSAD